MLYHLAVLYQKNLLLNSKYLGNKMSKIIKFLHFIEFYLEVENMTFFVLFIPFFILNGLPSFFPHQKETL